MNRRAGELLAISMGLVEFTKDRKRAWISRCGTDCRKQLENMCDTQILHRSETKWFWSVSDTDNRHSRSSKCTTSTTRLFTLPLRITPQHLQSFAVFRLEYYRPTSPFVIFSYIFPVVILNCWSLPIRERVAHCLIILAMFIQRRHQNGRLRRPNRRAVYADTQLWRLLFSSSVGHKRLAAAV